MMEQHVQTLERLASVRSRTEKIEILKQALQDTEFRKIVKFAIDPYITFGITDYTIEPDSIVGVSESLFEFLEKLSRREYTGNTAREIAGCYALVDDSVEQILRLILTKDLRCGIGPKTVNEAYPGLITEFLICLADKYDPFEATFPLLDSPKPDGVRGIVVCKPTGQVSILSRSGQEYVSLEALKPHVTPYLRRYPDGFMFDSELVCGTLQNTQSQVNRKTQATEEVLCYIFDFLPLPAFQAKTTFQPIEDRILIIEHLLEEHQGPLRMLKHRLVLDVNEADVAYRQNIEDGFEGSVYKRLGSQYQFCRTGDWLKRKTVETYDLPVLRMEEGTGKYTGMCGALVVDFNGKPVHIGSGMTDKNRIEFWKKMPSVVEVTLQGITPDGSLRHGRFKRVREDKI